MTRISKREAKRRFIAGETFVICPVKMRPGGPFSMSMTITNRHRDEHKKYGETDEKAWESFLDSWNWFNSSWEMGYYPAFYGVL